MLKKHILFLGSTGAGKSTTINKILGKVVAKIGEGVEPQTQKILGYGFFPLILWDTPGLGESPRADNEHIKLINDFISNGYYTFDKVVLVCESGKRDLNSIYRLIDEIVIPYNLQDKMILALNQCELAMKGQGWDYRSNAPDNSLYNFLDEQINIFGERIQKSTNIKINISMYYSAKFNFNINRLTELVD